MDNQEYEELWDERATFFDVDYKNYDDDVDFFKQYVSADTALLELGSGTGRLPLHLSEMASRADGIDLSSEMVEIAREKASHIDNVSFYQGDMADFTVDTEYDLIINQGNSFLMMEDDKKKSALEHVSNHLEADGKFVFQIANPERWRQNPQRTVLHLRTVTDGEKAVTITYTQNINESEQVNRMIWFREQVDTDTGDVTKHVWPIDFKFLSHKEAVKLIQSTGFKIEATYGDFDGSPWVEGADRMIFECTPQRS